MADAFETEKLRRMLPAELARIAFGVRYDPQLKLLDRIGTVMDEILKAEGTPFGAEQFPLSEIVPMQYRLLNTEENSELLINSQDTILQMPLRTRDAARVIELGRVFKNTFFNRSKDKETSRILPDTDSCSTSTKAKLQLLQILQLLVTCPRISPKRVRWQCASAVV